MALISVSFLAVPGCRLKEAAVLTDSADITMPGAGIASSEDLSDTTLANREMAMATLQAATVQETAAVTSAASTSVTAESKELQAAMADTGKPSGETITATSAMPITADVISLLPAGSIVDDFIKNMTAIDECFYYEEISGDLFDRMKNKSYNEDCTVPLSDLRYVRVLHYGFDGCVHVGELVVNQKIAEDMVEIFSALYDAGYPIERMCLIDDYNADDNASMAANNTSAFNYRVVSGTSTLSKHAMGLAVDVNPLYNPWIYKKNGEKVIDPAEGAAYADRTIDCEYYLDEEDLCVILFLEHGFAWGGNWKNSKDYQHFAKSF